MSKVIVVNGNDCYHGVTLKYENVISVTTESLGWFAEIAEVPYSDGVVTKLVQWIGGEGNRPTEYVGWYLGVGGFVENIEDAVVSGLQGDQGIQGYTPYVGSNENWWINGIDTGFPSRSVITIESGIWFVDGVSTGQKAQGEKGKEIELQKNATHIQWRYVGDNDWVNLVSLEDIRGPRGFNGESITNINPDSPTPSARLWIGTQQQYDNQQPLPLDAVTFILR